MLKRKVLLAEDDEDDRHFFQSFLQSRDDVVLLPIAEDGLLLIDQLQNINNEADLPDLIILDQNMPRQSGLQTLEFLKKDKRFRHIPIVIYSTYADENLVKKSSEKGACMVLAKPFNKEGYVEMIEQVFKACV